MIRLNEDYAMSVDRTLSELVLEKHFDGLVVFRRTTHPAVGRVVEMCTEEEFKERLEYAIAEREGRCETATSAFESRMEGGE